MKTIGFIGCGHMGRAIAQAVCKAAAPADVVLANRTRAKAEALAAELGCRAGTNEDAAGGAGVFWGAPPRRRPHRRGARPRAGAGRAARGERFVLCTMAAGLSVAQIRQMAGGGWPAVRIMPNTPAAVGAGMIQYCADGLTGEEEAEFCRLLAPAGLLDPLPEGLIDAAGCVSGCGPAWAYQFIEALADGGVACGLPRAKAQQYAAQMLLGAARLVLESGQHPGALKDAVCSPGGSTIEGVRLLERRAFRGAVSDAVAAACDKTKELGKG